MAQEEKHMITEDYVSFETAKLLKEKGSPLPSAYFRDWLCCMYDENGDIQWGCYHPNWYARVTLQMAMKWLREAHNIHIAVIVAYHHIPRRYEAHIMKRENIDDFILHQQVDFASYEEACEASIKYCLENLI